MQLPEKEFHLLRQKTSHILLKRKYLTLQKKELSALHSLQNDRTIVITKADKCNITMVINKKDYNTKAFEHFSTGPHQNIDSKTFKLLKIKLNQR